MVQETLEEECKTSSNIICLLDLPELQKNCKEDFGSEACKKCLYYIKGVLL